HVPLRDTRRDRRAREKGHDRVPADRARDRHRLTAGRVLQEVLAPVLAALDQEERRRVRLADHTAVDPDVHDARVGIARDDRGEGVDIPAPLEVVPLGNGELRLVDGPPAHDELLDGAGRHAPRRDRLAVLLHHMLHERRVRRVLPEAEGPGPPRGATNASVCDPTVKRTPAASTSDRSRSRPGRRRTSAYQRATGGTSHTATVTVPIPVTPFGWAVSRGTRSSRGVSSWIRNGATPRWAPRGIESTHRSW